MSPKNKVNILLVDDQPAKLLSYEAILGELGENLIKASSGKEALEKLLKNEVTVVLMDVSMPELDGFELASIIREHPRFQKTAIIFVSAVHLTDLDRVRGYASGAVDYVSVPVVPEILRAKVAVFVELYRRRQEWEQLNHQLEQRVAERTLELEHAAMRLRASEERFRFVAETVPSIVWTAAPDGKITYANRRWTEYTGPLKQGSLADWPDFALHPDDYQRVIAQRTHYLQRAEAFDIEARIRRFDGVYRWFVTRAVPRKSDTGEALDWFGITTDVHDQIELAEKLREADRRKDEFLALLAHELRNPLAPLRSAVELMQLKGAAEPEVQQYRDVIERQVDQLSRLVDDLLDVSRISRGKIKLQLEPVDLALVVAGAVEISRTLIDMKQHELIIVTPDQPVVVLGDQVRLTQVVANLLNNAAKYQNDGGRIEVIVTRAGADAIIRVSDWGVGIAPEKLATVFELFSQVEATLDRAQGGLGIGLSLVRSIVELHGGKVDARSAGEDRGSDFSIRLQCLADAPAKAVSKTVDTMPRSTVLRLQVLVVDDNQDGADSLSTLLRAKGHSVVVAHNGPRAIELATAQKPDVILLDIGLPEMDGYEVCRRLRAGGLAATLIIAVTGYGQERDRVRAQEAGFDAHVVKPVRSALLLKTMSNLLEQLQSNGGNSTRVRIDTIGA
ncbi:MAG: hybrid sensor histidine kinase/response regulator [Longimicrobiales bacterium]